jgi:hypothetical protein
MANETGESNQKPTIPTETLEKFLLEKIKTPRSKINNIHVGFLWEVDGVERYRINIWTKEKSEDSLSLKDMIADSFFVHYNRKSDSIVDFTKLNNKV